MKYKEYQKARDAAWRTLIAMHITKLPVKVSKICKDYGCVLRSYQSGKDAIEAFGLMGQCQCSDGFTTIQGGQYYIFYNPDMVRGRIRFTIAHELGHIVLGHVGVGGVTTQNREPEPNDRPIEHMANVFASRLLAPACVLHSLRVTDAQSVAALCDISLQSAQFRMERMTLLHERDRFLASPLETQVHRQFLPFIVSRKLFES